MMMSQKTFEDDRGRLIVNSISDHLPAFPIRRMFLIEGRAGKTRGYHAHKTCWQVIVIISGQWKINLETIKGTRICEYNPHPTHIFVVEPYTWATLEALSDDAKILVLCDKAYDPADYIHDRNEFEDICLRMNL